MQLLNALFLCLTEQLIGSISLKCWGFLWIYTSIGQTDLNEILGLDSKYQLSHFCFLRFKF